MVSEMCGVYNNKDEQPTKKWAFSKRRRRDTQVKYLERGVKFLDGRRKEWDKYKNHVSGM